MGGNKMQVKFTTRGQGGVILRILTEPPIAKKQKIKIITDMEVEIIVTEEVKGQVVFCGSVEDIYQPRVFAIFDKQTTTIEAYGEKGQKLIILTSNRDFIELPKKCKREEENR